MMDFSEIPPHILIRDFAINSYLYEVHNISPLSDGVFDQLCRYMLDNYQTVKPADINDYINESDLESGTGSTVAYIIAGLTKAHADTIVEIYKPGMSWDQAEKKSLALMKKRGPYKINTNQLKEKAETMADKTVVEEIEHSRLGASSAKRWMSCPGSIRQSANLPPEAFEAGEPAAEGTAAHELAAMCLETKTDAWEHAGKTYEVGKYSFEVDQNMVDAVQGFLDFVWSKMDEYDDASLYVERSLSSILHEQAFGTADVTIEIPSIGLLVVADYKHGRHIGCEPEEPQTWYYGYLALENSDHEFSDVDLWIYQPRHPHPKGSARKHSIPADELVEWFTDVVVPAMDDTNDPESMFAMGDWCRFCPAKVNCPALSEGVKAFKMDTPAGTLTGDELGDMIEMGGHIGKYVDTLKEEAFNRIRGGDPVKGLKLVNKKSNRTWRTEKTVKGETVELDINKMLEADFGDDAYQPRTFKTVPNIEKLPDGKSFVKKYAYKPNTGLTIAATSDKRVEVKPLLDLLDEQNSKL